MYDYSVCKVGDKITKWKGKLDNGIVEYINNYKSTIATSILFSNKH